MPPELEFDTEVMRREAASWGEVATSLGEAAGAVGAARLSALQMGVVAFLHGAYDGLQSRATTLLEGGATEAGEIATTLQRAATTYERDEAAAEADVVDAFS